MRLFPERLPRTVRRRVKRTGPQDVIRVDKAATPGLHAEMAGIRVSASPRATFPENLRPFGLLGLIAAATVAPCLAAPPVSPPLSDQDSMPTTPPAMQRASGTFRVTLTPLPAKDAVFNILTIAKTFAGEMVGDSAGQMMSFRSATEGSAGYVAMERVNATLAGRKGSFMLQHSGIMDKGARSLAITVVPDSGTDALAGLSGRMDIRIEDGNHFYDFDYHLPK